MNEEELDSKDAEYGILLNNNRYRNLDKLSDSDFTSFYLNYFKFLQSIFEKEDCPTSITQLPGFTKSEFSHIKGYMPQIEEIITNLDQALKYKIAIRYTKTNDKLHKFIQGLASDVVNLKENESVLFPIVYDVNKLLSDGHKILMLVSKKKHALQFEVFNSGGGIEKYHDSISSPKGEKYYPQICYKLNTAKSPLSGECIKKEELTTAIYEYLKKILKYSKYKKWDISTKKIYNELINSLVLIGGKRVDAQKIVLPLAMAHCQNGKNCGVVCYKRYIKAKLFNKKILPKPKDDFIYRIIMHGFDLYSLNNYYNHLKENNRLSNPFSVKQLHEICENIARNVLKISAHANTYSSDKELKLLKKIIKSTIINQPKQKPTTPDLDKIYNKLVKRKVNSANVELETKNLILGNIKPAPYDKIQMVYSENINKDINKFLNILATHKFNTDFEKIDFIEEFYFNYHDSSLSTNIKNFSLLKKLVELYNIYIKAHKDNYNYLTPNSILIAMINIKWCFDTQYGEELFLYNRKLKQVCKMHLAKGILDKLGKNPYVTFHNKRIAEIFNNTYATLSNAIMRESPIKGCHIEHETLEYYSNLIDRNLAISEQFKLSEAFEKTSEYTSLEENHKSYLKNRKYKLVYIYFTQEEKWIRETISEESWQKINYMFEASYYSSGLCCNAMKFILNKYPSYNYILQCNHKDKEHLFWVHYNTFGELVPGLSIGYPLAKIRYCGIIYEELTKTYPKLKNPDLNSALALLGGNIKKIPDIMLDKTEKGNISCTMASHYDEYRFDYKKFIDSLINQNIIQVNITNCNATLTKDSLVLKKIYLIVTNNKLRAFSLFDFINRNQELLQDTDWQQFITMMLLANDTTFGNRQTGGINPEDYLGLFFRIISEYHPNKSSSVALAFCYKIFFLMTIRFCDDAEQELKGNLNIIFKKLIHQINILKNNELKYMLMDNLCLISAYKIKIASSIGTIEERLINYFITSQYYANLNIKEIKDKILVEEDFKRKLITNAIARIQKYFSAKPLKELEDTISEILAEHLQVSKELLKIPQVKLNSNCTLVFNYKIADNEEKLGEIDLSTGALEVGSKQKVVMPEQLAGCYIYKYFFDNLRPHVKVSKSKYAFQINGVKYTGFQDKFILTRKFFNSNCNYRLSTGTDAKKLYLPKSYNIWNRTHYVEYTAWSNKSLKKNRYSYILADTLTGKVKYALNRKGYMLEFDDNEMKTGWRLSHLKLDPLLNKFESNKFIKYLIPIGDKSQPEYRMELVRYGLSFKATKNSNEWQIQSVEYPGWQLASSPGNFIPDFENYLHLTKSNTDGSSSNRILIPIRRFVHNEWDLDPKFDTIQLEDNLYAKFIKSCKDITFDNIESIKNRYNYATIDIKNNKLVVNSTTDHLLLAYISFATYNFDETLFHLQHIERAGSIQYNYTQIELLFNIINNLPIIPISLEPGSKLYTSFLRLQQRRTTRPEECGIRLYAMYLLEKTLYNQEIQDSIYKYSRTHNSILTFSDAIEIFKRNRIKSFISTRKNTLKQLIMDYNKQSGNIPINFKLHPEQLIFIHELKQAPNKALWENHANLLMTRDNRYYQKLNTHKHYGIQLSPKQERLLTLTTHSYRVKTIINSLTNSYYDKFPSFEYNSNILSQYKEQVENLKTKDECLKLPILIKYDKRQFVELFASFMEQIHHDNYYVKNRVKCILSYYSNIPHKHKYLIPTLSRMLLRSRYYNTNDFDNNWHYFNYLAKSTNISVIHYKQAQLSKERKTYRITADYDKTILDKLKCIKYVKEDIVISEYGILNNPLIQELAGKFNKIDEKLQESIKAETNKTSKEKAKPSFSQQVNNEILLDDIVGLKIKQSRLDKKELCSCLYDKELLRDLEIRLKSHFSLLEKNIARLKTDIKYKSSYPNKKVKYTEVKLKLLAKQYQHPSLDELIMLFCKGYIDYYQERMPHLTQNHIKSLHKTIFEYLQTTVEYQLVEKILITINKILDDKSTNLKESLYHLACLILSRQYTNPNISPEQFAYQAIEKILLRQDQVEILNETLSPFNSKNVLHHLHVGWGKSKVYLPLAAYRLANGANLVFIIVPEAHLETCYNDLHSINNYQFLPRITKFIFNRQIGNLKGIADKIMKIFSNAIINQGIIITTPESIQSLDLKVFETLSSISINSFNLEENFQYKQYSIWQNINKLIKNNGIALIEEADHSLEMNKFLNYTLGSGAKVSSEQIKAIVKLYHFFKDIKVTDIVETKQESTLNHLVLNKKLLASNSTLWQDVYQRLAEQLIVNAKSPIKSIVEDMKEYTSAEFPISLMIEYFMGKRDEPVFMSQLRNETSKNILTLYKELISKIFQTVLTKEIYNNYGPSQNKDTNILFKQLPKTYRGSNNPKERCKPGHYLEYLCLAVQMQLITHDHQNLIQPDILEELENHLQPELVLKIVIKNIINSAISEANLNNITDLNKTNIVKPFLSALAADGFIDINIGKIDINNEKSFTEFVRSLRNKRNTIDYILSYYLLTEARIDSTVLSHSSTDHVAQFKRVIAITGTNWCYRGMHYTLSQNHRTAIGVTGMTAADLRHNREDFKGDSTPVHIISAKSSIQYIKSAYKKMFAPDKLYAIIDEKGEFCGIKNSTIAKQLGSIYEANSKSKIKWVLFFDTVKQNDSKTSHILKAYKCGSKNKIVTISSSKLENINADLSKKLKFKLGEYAVYFSQQHTINTDIKLPEDAHALVLVGANTTRSSLFQAVGRLRQLSALQCAQICISSETAKTIKIKQDSWTIDAVLELVTRTEKDILAKHHPKGALQNISTIIREHIKAKIQKSETPKQELSCFHELRPFIVQENTEISNKASNQPIKSVSFKDYLEQVVNNILKQLEKLDCHISSSNHETLSNLIPIFASYCDEEISSRTLAIDENTECELEVNLEIDLDYQSYQTNPNTSPRSQYNEFILNTRDISKLFKRYVLSSYKISGLIEEIAPYKAKNYNWFSKNILISSNLKEVHELQYNHFDAYKCEIEAILVYIKDSEEVKFLALSGSDLHKIMSRQSALSSKCVFLMTPSETIIAGRRPEKLPKEYFIMLEQIQFINGNIFELSQSVRDLCWLTKDAKLKMDFFKSHLAIHYSINNQHLHALERRLSNTSLVFQFIKDNIYIINFKGFNWSDKFPEIDDDSLKRINNVCSVITSIRKSPRDFLNEHWESRKDCPNIISSILEEFAANINAIKIFLTAPREEFNLITKAIFNLPCIEFNGTTAAFWLIKQKEFCTLNKILSNTGSELKNCPLTNKSVLIHLLEQHNANTNALNLIVDIVKNTRIYHQFDNNANDLTKLTPFSITILFLALAKNNKIETIDTIVRLYPKLIIRALKLNKEELNLANQVYATKLKQQTNSLFSIVLELDIINVLKFLVEKCHIELDIDIYNLPTNIDSTHESYNYLQDRLLTAKGLFEKIQANQTDNIINILYKHPELANLTYKYNGKRYTTLMAAMHTQNFILFETLLQLNYALADQTFVQNQNILQYTIANNLSGTQFLYELLTYKFILLEEPDNHGLSALDYAIIKAKGKDYDDSHINAIVDYAVDYDRKDIIQRCIDDKLQRIFFTSTFFQDKRHPYWFVISNQNNIHQSFEPSAAELILLAALERYVIRSNANWVNYILTRWPHMKRRILPASKQYISDLVSTLITNKKSLITASKKAPVDKINASIARLNSILANINKARRVNKYNATNVPAAAKPGGPKI